MWDVRCVSGMERVFMDRAPQPMQPAAWMPANGLYFFQIAYRADEGDLVGVNFSGSAAAWAEARETVLVPSQLPAYPGFDEHYERTAPGLFPDPLLPIPEYGIPCSDLGGWRSVTVILDAQERPMPQGETELHVSLTSTQTGACRGTVDFKLRIAPPMTASKPLYTCWMYLDCMAQAHHAALWTEEFWTLLARYMRLAVRFGVNVLLTPLVTPPLETAVGLYRMPVQLVDITRDGDDYSFDFSRFDRFAALARKAGVERFEIGHLFSQWGATAAAQVIARENGVEKRIFGWNDRADSEAYRSFLRALLSAFGRHAQEKGVAEMCLYHVSDEPGYEQREAYAQGRRLLEECLGPVTVIDAMSDYRLYKEGYVTTPVPALDAIAPFVANNVRPLWGYYCCVQTQKVSNRFFSMPLSRTRVLGVQMYLNGMTGFLHWGFNHYNASQSRERIDPYLVTDARLAFPSGDAFCVYPAQEDGAPSLRMAAFQAGLEDMRILGTLEEKIGRERVVALIEETAGMKVTFEQYPHDAAFLPRLRVRALAMLAGAWEETK